MLEWEKKCLFGIESTAVIRFIRTEIIPNIINDLELNPNVGGQQSPNIPHWIESKKYQLRKKWLGKEWDERNKI